MQKGSLISFPVFKSYSKLLCVFSTRLDGYSQGIYSGLNLGRHTGDQTGSIKKNRESFFRYLALEEKQVAYGEQMHTANVMLVMKPGIFKKTDALITRQKNVFLAVLTADCFPVFLFDPLSAAVAVIHAGWKGTQAGIIENVLHLLKFKLNIKAERMVAAIGPGLQSECFEVREDVYSLFAARYLSLHQDPDKKYLNLRQVIMDKLVQQGLRENQIEWNPECTMCSAEKFYSHRRQGKNSGRMMGIIGIH